jgi:hypothetical protein
VNGHGRIVCSCGALIAQCRCFAHHNVQVIEKGCDRCKRLLAPAAIRVDPRVPVPDLLKLYMQPMVVALAERIEADLIALYPAEVDDI